MYSKTHTLSIELNTLLREGLPWSISQEPDVQARRMWNGHNVFDFVHSLSLAQPASTIQPMRETNHANHAALNVMPFMPSTWPSPWSLVRLWCAPICSHGPCRASTWWWWPSRGGRRWGLIGRLTSPWRRARCGRCTWDGRRRWPCLRDPCWSLVRQWLRRPFGWEWSGPGGC